jgi:excisionase family DNA binding protein
MATFSVKQVAEKLGVAPATVYSLCGRRRLKHQRIGLGRGVIRIREEDLEQYLAGATVEPEEPAAPPPPRPTKLKHLKL